MKFLTALLLIAAPFVVLADRFKVYTTVSQGSLNVNVITEKPLNDQLVKYNMTILDIHYSPSNRLFRRSLDREEEEEIRPLLANDLDGHKSRAHVSSYHSHFREHAPSRKSHGLRTIRHAKEHVYAAEVKLTTTPRKPITILSVKIPEDHALRLVKYDISLVKAEASIFHDAIYGINTPSEDLLEPSLDV
jgi:hypothetical protein